MILSNLSIISLKETWGFFGTNFVIDAPKSTNPITNNYE